VTNVNIGIFLKIEVCEGGSSFIRVNTVNSPPLFLYTLVNVYYNSVKLGKNIYLKSYKPEVTNPQHTEVEIFKSKDKNKITLNLCSRKIH
jgi:hypothetical protein